MPCRGTVTCELLDRCQSLGTRLSSRPPSQNTRTQTHTRLHTRTHTHTRATFHALNTSISTKNRWRKYSRIEGGDNH